MFRRAFKPQTRTKLPSSVTTGLVVFAAILAAKPAAEAAKGLTELIKIKVDEIKQAKKGA